jgi:cell division septation protein DedD
VASQTQDDSFHEIQLNGKQLVFLFMAATVVSVVIFLCGVLVGRGVRAERAATEVAAVNPVADAAALPPSQAPSPAPAGSDPTAAPPPAPAADDLTYFDRLEKQKSPAEQLRAPAPDSGGKADKTDKDKKDKADKNTSRTERAAGGAATSTPPAVQPRAPAGLPASAAQPAEPAGQGYAVQIAALNVRSEAEAIAKRLASKGYAAYVLAPPSGTPAVYRVRVGKFPTRREAESIAARLKKEEQFNPWVTK